MNNHGILEMQRLLRLVAERDQECGRLCARAIEKAAFAVPAMPLKQFMLKVYEALPGATYTDMERGILCPSSELPGKEMQGSKHHTDQRLSVL